MARGDIVPNRRGGSLIPWKREEGIFEGIRHEIESLHRDLDRVFENVRGGGLLEGFETLGRAEVMPRLDIAEDDQAFHINVELPGMDEKDVDVTLSNHTLTIKGEKKEEKETKDKDIHRRDRSYGCFRRSVELPTEVDAGKISATYRKGVLTVDLPKSKQA